jgi:hypothetical protein
MAASPVARQASVPPPFFRVSYHGTQLHTEGLPNAVFGHIVPGAGTEHDGIFVEWAWTGDRFVVTNCRYGLYPVYYYASERELAISTSIRSLLEHGAPAALDVPALALFLRLGFFLGEDTGFRHIHALPPNCQLEWTPAHGLHAIRAGSLTIRRPQHYTREAAIDGYIQLFREAIARRPPQGRHCVPLSGGRDSRHIVLELCNAEHPPSFVITARLFPPDGNRDHDIAVRVAAALGLRHMTADQPARRLPNETVKNVVTEFCADEHSWLLPLAYALQGQADTLYDGIGGDVLSAGLFLDHAGLEAIRRSPEAFARHLIHSRSGSQWLRLLTPAATETFSEELALDRLRRECERHREAPNPVGSFFFWNRTRREISLSPYAIMRGIPLVYSPYLDHAVFDHLASLPAEMFLDHSFHDEAIRKGYPRYRELPFEDKAAPRRVDRQYGRVLAGELLGFVRGHRQTRLVGSRRVVGLLLMRMIDGNHLHLEDLVNPSRLVYLLQLERFVAGLDEKQGPDVTVG